MERATLLGVVQQQIVAVQCPLLQGLPVQISLLISPVWMMAVKSLQLGLQDEEGLVADLCCSSVQFHPRDTQAYRPTFKYFQQTHQRLEVDRIEFTMPLSSPYCYMALRHGLS